MVQKGKVSAVLDGGKAVTVTPYAGGTVTAANRPDRGAVFTVRWPAAEKEGEA
jgi:hypothetical protein